MKTKTITKEEKRSLRREHIIESAVEVLKKNGYTQTNLREIAAHSGYTLGVLHYYFENKTELMACCISFIKIKFMKDLNIIIDESSSRESAINNFSTMISASIVDNWEEHCLWYDMRSQAKHEPLFHETFVKIESGLVDFIDKLRKAIGSNIDSHVLYAAIDGLFRMYTLQAISNNLSKDELASGFKQLISRF